MLIPRPSGGSRLVFVAALFALLLAGNSRPACAQSPPADVPPSVEQGAWLFLGQARLQNGGPPCGSCHQLSTLGFPNGGIVGPDLSSAYATLGPDGIDVTLQTLFFPTMVPLYDRRPLTPAEQQALKALLQQAAPGGTGSRGTIELAGIAAAGFVVLLALTWFAWRHRLRAVRAALVRRAAPGGA